MAPAQGVLHRATFTLGVISLILNFASAFNGVRLPVQEYSEKLEKWRRDGVGSAWDAYFFRTLTALRQAIGRLIRCHSDAGDVLILEVDSNAAHRVDRWMNTFFPGVQLEEC